MTVVAMGAIGATGTAGGSSGRPPPFDATDCSRKSSIARIAALLWRRCE